MVSSIANKKHFSSILSSTFDIRGPSAIIRLGWLSNQHLLVSSRQIELQMATHSSAEKGGLPEANEERSAYKLLGYTVILPPAAASVAISGGSYLLLLVIGFAFFYLALMVLPVAFAGLTIGYFLARWKNQSSYARMKFTVVGYVAGFIAGLDLV